MKYLKNMWKYRNLPGEIIGLTPYIEDGRGYEIKAWLNKNIDKVETYCIIDDDDDILEEQINNFVKTSGNFDHIDCDDIGYGLTKVCADNVIKILNK